MTDSCDVRLFVDFVAEIDAAFTAQVTTTTMPNGAFVAHVKKPSCKLGTSWCLGDSDSCRQLGYPAPRLFLPRKLRLSY